jgi:hypothetical protein
VTIDDDMYRAQWDHHGPWWFSTRTENRNAGRFDLTAPDGTCYFADDPLAAIIEKLADPQQDQPMVPVEELERLRVWSGRLPSPWDSIADATDRAARIPKELGTVVPYDLPWEWADALHDAGRCGLRYWLRLDPGPGRGVAVFSDEGAPGEAFALDHEPATAYTNQLRGSFDIFEPTITLDELVGADEP